MSLVLVKSLEGFLWTYSSHLTLSSSLTQNKVAIKLQNLICSELVNLCPWRKVQQMKKNVSFDLFSFFQHVYVLMMISDLKNPQKMYEIHENIIRIFRETGKEDDRTSTPNTGEMHHQTLQHC